MLIDIQEVFYDCLNSQTDDTLIRASVFSLFSRVAVYYSMPMYNEGNTLRYYHNFNHVLSCISALNRDKEELGLFEDEYQKIFVGLLFHDVCFNPYKKNPMYSDEQESAQSLKLFLDVIYSNSKTSPTKFIQDVHDLILQTEHFTGPEPKTYLDKVIRDIDLLGLGSDWKTYKNNGDLIRMEFGEFTQEEFIAGRKSFLEQMIARDEVFMTPFYYEKYENQSRENMERELDGLG